MKRKCTFLLTALFLLISMPYAEAGTKDYCNTLINTSGVNYYLSFEKVGGKYQATINVEGNHKLYMYPHSKPSGYESHTGEGTATIVITYSSKPNSTSFNAVCLDGTSSQVNFYFYSHNNDEINWENSCGPVLAITSATLASKTSSEIVLNVTSTEATKYKVMCSQFTRELTVSSGTAADGQITLSGLSASTTYNLTVYAMDGSGNTSSSGISLSVTTDAPPAETTPPTIGDLTYALTGNGYSTANITVQATDNIGITRVVIKNGSTGLLDQGVTSTTSLNQAFAVSGLPIGATTTLTVTVYDAAGNNSSKTISVTTNTPNPQMTSASVASTTQNSVTLNVASTGGNGYKVTYGGNTINTTATNGQITITSLNSGTTYNLTVYAMYDTYECSNPITVKAKTVEVGCSGTSTTCTSGGSEFVSYKINYIGGNILFTVKSTTANQLTSCKLNYATSSSGANAVSNLPMTITNGEATYTLPATGNIASGTLYFSFTYKTGGMGSEGSTTSGWNSAFQYPIGGCALDDGMPYMQSATKAGATTSSITLDVSAVVNIDGVASNTAVTQYNVSVNGAAAQTLTATNGQITVNGLTANTSYNFEVWAIYDVYTSENSKTVTASTNKESECAGTRGHFGYDAAGQANNPRINFEITYDAGQITMTFEDADGGKLDFLQIEWNIPGIASRTVNTSNDVTLSDGKATYNLSADQAWIGNPMGILILYSNTNMGGNLQTSDNNNPETGNGVIYYVVGECGCEPDDGSIPVMGEVEVAHVTPTTVTLNVNATDQHSTVTVFELNGKDYYATDGQITIKNLSECSTYNWTIRAKDPSCNISKNSVTVTANTTQNHALQAHGASAQYNLNTADGNWSIDGNLASRGGSQDTREDVTIEEALNNSIFTVDLGEIRMVNEIDIYWERACATDYELQASVDGNYWSTIRRYTDMPEWTIDAPARGAAHEVYQFYEIPARYLRVKPNMLYVAAKWGMSIWEFEAYGPCLLETKECPVILDVRSVYTRSQEAIISVSAIDHQTVDPTELTYIVTVETDVPNRRTLTNTYTFAPGVAGREDKQASTELTLQGLVPGTDYTISVQAKDPQGNISCNTNSTTIRTGKAEGCTMVQEGSSVIETGDWKPFPDGMTYRVELENSDAGDEFTVTLTFDGKPADMEISTVYFAIEKQATGADCYAGWVEQAMERDGDIFTKTYSKNDTYARKGSDGCGEDTGKDYTFPLFTNWPEVEIYFKIESSEGIIHTNYFDYNASEKTCEEYFIIFHEGSQPSSNMNTAYDGSTIPHEIFYYRLLNPGEWTPLCLPFEVDRVSVYDAEDRQYYDLKAKTASKENQFWMRQQVANVSGEDFETSWYDGTDELPRKNVPYNFAVPTTGGYYDNKYIVFHGAAGQTIETNFELGARPTQDDQYTLYGNNTLMPQTITNAYKEDDDGAYYRLQEEWTLNPFECYVLASQETVRRMPIIGRWRSQNDATMIDNVTATQIVPEICIYTILGQPIHTLKQCSLLDAQTYIEQNMASGYYVLATQNAITKVLIP